jgi:phosphoglycolate phosphatase-like HAD superfamily hydrolase
LNIDKYEIVIFDCDGVIFDTNNLKINAFKTSLSNFSDHHINEFLAYFAKNFGRSRYVHVKHFICNILDIQFDQQLYDQIIYDYGVLCQDLYSNADICLGVEDLLKRLSSAKKYIASGSDQIELRKVFHDRSLAKYFNLIYGSPVTKNDLVKKICSNYQGKNILMVGDAKSDYIAAQKSDIDFLHVTRYAVDQSFMEAKNKNSSFNSIIDFTSLV